MTYLAYTVRVTTPSGDVLDESVWANSAEDAQRQAAEQLARDTGMTPDDATQYVGDAQLLKKYA